MVIYFLIRPLVSVFLSLLLGFGEATKYLPMVSTKLSREHRTPNEAKHSVPFIGIAEASSRMYNMLRPRLRSLTSAEKIVLLKDITIYFKGLPKSFDENSRQAFEKSTKIYFTESVLAETPGFKFSAKMTYHGRGYVVCDFEIELQGEAAPSLYAAEAMFRSLLAYSFNDAFSNKFFIKILKDSSIDFQNINAVSLIDKNWTPEPTSIVTGNPTSFPTSPLKEFDVGGIFLELYGINTLNALDRYLLEVITEKFLQKAIVPELGADFEQVTIKITESKDYFFSKVRVELQATGFCRSVRSMRSLELDNYAVKNILMEVFHLKQNDYLSELIVFSERS